MALAKTHKVPAALAATLQTQMDLAGRMELLSPLPSMTTNLTTGLPVACVSCIAGLVLVLEPHLSLQPGRLAL